MAFDTSSFLSSSSLSPITRTLSSTIGTVYNDASSIATQLSSGGSSIASIVQTSTQKLDALISDGGSQFFGFAGKAVERISPQDLTIYRADTGSNQDTGSINPQTKISDSQNNSGSGDSLSYPNDMGDYFIAFKFADYSRPSPTSPATFQTQYTINLPVPNNLQEAYKTDYSETNLGVIGMLADSLTYATDIARGRSKGIGSSNAFKMTTGDITGAAYSGLDYLLSDISGLGEPAVAALGQYFGAIPNPHIAVSFKGPSFRVHQFKWRLAPESVDDSSTIKQIIRQFRKRMLPTKSLSNSANILDYPQIVMPELFPKDSEGDELYIFKKAVIPQVFFNYAPLGVPSFFAGTKMPTLIDLQVNLLEIEYFLGDDPGFDRDTSSNFFGDVANTAQTIYNKALGLTSNTSFFSK